MRNRSFKSFQSTSYEKWAVVFITRKNSKFLNSVFFLNSVIFKHPAFMFNNPKEEADEVITAEFYC